MTNFLRKFKICATKRGKTRQMTAVSKGNFFLPKCDSSFLLPSYMENLVCLQYKKLLKVVKYFYRVRKGHFHQRFQQIFNIFDNCEGFLTKLYHEPKDGGERHEGCDRENQPLHGFEPWPFDEFTWTFWSWSGLFSVFLSFTAIPGPWFFP